MLISESAARAKWCPMVRLSGSNRLYNTMTDGFQNSEAMYHCVGPDCMGWRGYHLSHLKGSGTIEKHGYCGFAGRPESD